MTARLHPDDEKELRLCSRSRSASMPGVLLRAVLAELDATRVERDQAQARANELPGLTAALDEARWERDVAKGEQTAGGQALAEIERLRAERDKALGDAEQRERSWWETRVRLLINSAEETLDGRPLARWLENLIDERAKSAKEKM